VKGMSPEEKRPFCYPVTEKDISEEAPSFLKEVRVLSEETNFRAGWIVAQFNEDGVPTWYVHDEIMVPDTYARFSDRTVSVKPRVYKSFKNAMRRCNKINKDVFRGWFVSLWISDDIDIKPLEKYLRMTGIELLSSPRQ